MEKKSCECYICLDNGIPLDVSIIADILTPDFYKKIQGVALLSNICACKSMYAHKKCLMKWMNQTCNNQCPNCKIYLPFSLPYNKTKKQYDNNDVFRSQIINILNELLRLHSIILRNNILNEFSRLRSIRLRNNIQEIMMSTISLYLNLNWIDYDDLYVSSRTSRIPRLELGSGYSSFFSTSEQVIGRAIRTTSHSIVNPINYRNIYQSHSSEFFFNRYSSEFFFNRYIHPLSRSIISNLVSSNFSIEILNAQNPQNSRNYRNDLLRIEYQPLANDST